MSDQPGDAETTSTSVRHRWTNDVLAAVIVLAHVALLAGVANGVEVPRILWEVFALETVLAVTWAFGRETLAAIGEFRGGGSS